MTTENLHMDTTERIALARLTADVVAVDGDGRLLLIRRKWAPFKGLPALPGGHVEPHEAAETWRAATRELLEETDVYAAPREMVYLGTWARPGRDPRGRYATDAYLARVPSGTQLTAGDDARTAAWVPLDDLPEKLAFDHGLIVQAARQHL